MRREGYKPWMGEGSRYGASEGERAKRMNERMGGRKRVNVRAEKVLKYKCVDNIMRAIVVCRVTVHSTFHAG